MRHLALAFSGVQVECMSVHSPCLLLFLSASPPRWSQHCCNPFTAPSPHNARPSATKTHPVQPPPPFTDRKILLGTHCAQSIHTTTCTYHVHLTCLLPHKPLLLQPLLRRLSRATDFQTALQTRAKGISSAGTNPQARKEEEGSCRYARCWMTSRMRDGNNGLYRRMQALFTTRVFYIYI